MASTPDNTTLISRDKPVSPAMDYSSLREQGISYIQNLASDLWTDYNIHDPGVTILEMLAYAITDISARAYKPVQDLLASKPGALPAEKDFFSAAEILPCSAVTLNDFRKLLIDQDLIRNAWLSPSSTTGLAFYLDPVSQTLNYTTGDPITLNGLYDVLLEFEEDDLLGDLNSSLIQDPDGTIEVAFPFWDEVPAAWTGDINFAGIILEDVTGSGDQLRPLDMGNDHDYFAILDVSYGTSMDRIPVTVKAADGVAMATIITRLMNTGSDSLVKAYNQKVIAANKILVGIRKFLSLNRNLCEDFFAFKASRVQEIGVTLTLKIAAGIDVEQTLGEIFHRLDNFFSPAIPFYTLDQMLAKGWTPDVIFEGPLLQHGFIDDNDLEELKRSNVIYTSDLVRLIMSLNDDFNFGNSGFVKQSKGIVALEDLSITNYINNQPISENVRNCLSLASVDIYKPKLSIDKSNITMLKDKTEIPYDPIKVKKAFNDLKIPGKPSPPASLPDIAIPAGTNLQVEDYYSIQNDFPLTYGISHAGLPDSASNERKAQAKQLKGFLLFFEQLLANYLSQLAHIKDLFSINAGVNATYFWQVLDTVPDAGPLLSSGYAANLPVLLQQLETSPTAISRRNNFLDHLLARFGEDFTDLALLTYSKYGDAATDLLIQDKSAFLKTYGGISYNRSRSFDYTDPAPWGTGNVPWLKRRIAGLLGITAFVDQDLSAGNVEGFHMIENILLRPKINDLTAGNVDAFLNVNLQYTTLSDGTKQIIPCTEDPYSFRLIFVFPKWPERFQGEDFKNYIKKIIQRETPAFILADIRWVENPVDIQPFETAFKTWLAANATATDDTVLTAAKNQLITAINALPVE